MSRGAPPPIIDYASMDRDALVDHFIDEDGLATFIDTQMVGIDEALWDWRVIARDIRGFCNYLTFSPEYLRELYAMQCERIRSQAEKEKAA